MDKDLLRIVIIAVGTVIILGMIVWGMFSNRSKRKRINFYDNKDPLENIDPSLVVSTEDDDFDIVPLSAKDNNSQVKTRLNANYTKKAEQSDDDLDPSLDLDLDAELLRTLEESTDEIPETIDLKEHLPSLLQLSIVAKANGSFTGTQLLDAFENVGLIYGSVKVFERLDYLNQVDYAVASMADTGVFPGDNWETYSCPGVTFFMQPREVDNAAVVFNEMIETVGQLSALLKGDVLDENQQLLTEQSLQQIKASLV